MSDTVMHALTVGQNAYELDDVSRKSSDLPARRHNHIICCAPNSRTITKHVFQINQNSHFGVDAQAGLDSGVT
eukprot:1187014-Pyramimonas_sp.AAC.1